LAYYQEEIERLPREKMAALQSKRLVKQVRHVYENVAPYRKKMQA